MEEVKDFTQLVEEELQEVPQEVLDRIEDVERSKSGFPEWSYDTTKKISKAFYTQKMYNWEKSKNKDKRAKLSRRKNRSKK